MDEHEGVAPSCTASVPSITRSRRIAADIRPVILYHFQRTRSEKRRATSGGMP
jgi:hypothetical protein